MSENSNNIRLLKASEIECRIGTINEKGLSLLLYKDARVDMRILDEVYGPMNWQRFHEVIDGKLYCTVSIWDDDKGQWICKEDVGTESMTEKEKGAASDSFKRACFSVGIGRELYTAPFIWIPSSRTNIQMRNNKYVTNDKFSVKEISYNEDREIIGLTIVNQNGNIVYKMQEGASNSINVADKVDQSESYKESINKELIRTGVALDAVLQRYGVASLDDMDDSLYRKALSSLRKTKSKAA